MPPTQVFFFQEERGIPVRSWLQELQQTDKRVYAKCVARIRLLAQLGHELRRPLADYLEEDIYELRIRTAVGSTIAFSTSSMVGIQRS